MPKTPFYSSYSFPLRPPSDAYRVADIHAYGNPTYNNDPRRVVRYPHQNLYQPYPQRSYQYQPPSRLPSFYELDHNWHEVYQAAPPSYAYASTHTIQQEPSSHIFPHQRMSTPQFDLRHPFNSTTTHSSIHSSHLPILRNLSEEVTGTNPEDQLKTLESTFYPSHSTRPFLYTDTFSNKRDQSQLSSRVPTLYRLGHNGHNTYPSSLPYAYASTHTTQQEEPFSQPPPLQRRCTPPSDLSSPLNPATIHSSHLPVLSNLSEELKDTDSENQFKTLESTPEFTPPPSPSLMNALPFEGTPYVDNTPFDNHTEKSLEYRDYHQPTLSSSQMDTADYPHHTTQAPLTEEGCQHIAFSNSELSQSCDDTSIDFEIIEDFIRNAHKKVNHIGVQKLIAIHTLASLDEVIAMKNGELDLTKQKWTSSSNTVYDLSEYICERLKEKKTKTKPPSSSYIFHKTVPKRHSFTLSAREQVQIHPVLTKAKSRLMLTFNSAQQMISIEELKKYKESMLKKYDSWEEYLKTLTPQRSTDLVFMESSHLFDIFLQLSELEKKISISNSDLPKIIRRKIFFTQQLREKKTHRSKSGSLRATTTQYKKFP